TLVLSQSTPFWRGRLVRGTLTRGYE
ncbi:MAG: hypothetical protein QOI47_2282, partial [Actinomycetota bacterium]|nr:hypothetical protein [Actinomycetota bacterium]